jgi:hypothetical protein
MAYALMACQTAEKEYGLGIKGYGEEACRLVSLKAKKFFFNSPIDCFRDGSGLNA